MRYARSVIALGGVTLALSLWNWSSARPIFFAIYFGLSIAASMLKFRLPKIEGTYSVNFLFTLIGIAEFSLPETLAATCAGAVIQCIWKAKQRPSIIQILFSIANLAISTSLVSKASFTRGSGDCSRPGLLGTGPVGSRNLRARQLLGQPAYSRNRHPRGAGRESRRGSKTRPPAGREAGGHGYDGGLGWLCCHGPRARFSFGGGRQLTGFALWTTIARSRRVRDHVALDLGHCPPSLLHTSAPSDQSRSHDCAAIRVVEITEETALGAMPGGFRTQIAHVFCDLISLSPCGYFPLPPSPLDFRRN